MKPSSFVIHHKIAATPGEPDGENLAARPAIQKNLPYLHTKAGTENVNLNMDVKFIDTANMTAYSGDVAACRHFSTALGLKALAEPHGKIALSDVDSPHSIAPNITPAADQSYKSIHSHSQNVSVFENDQFAAFLKIQFGQMDRQSMAAPQLHGHEALAAPNQESAAESNGYKTIGVKTFLIESTNHAMLLRLRVKEKQGVPLYVASFYDPNRTACLVRCEVSDLKELGRVTGTHSLAAFINPVVNGQVDTGDYDAYFPHGTEPIAIAYEVPAEGSGASASVEAGGRRLQRRDCHSSPTLMAHLMAGGFSGDIDDITAELKEGGLPATRDLIEAMDSDGAPGLFRALQHGHPDAIRAWGALLALMPDAERRAIVKDLLLAKFGYGIPGVLMAFQFGHADAVREWGALLALTPDTERRAIVKDLLAAKDINGILRLYWVLKDGPADTIREWGALLALVSEKELGAIIKDLLETKDAHGNSVLFRGLKDGHADAIRAWGSLLRWVPPNECAAMVKDLLAAKDAGGTPGLSFALGDGKASAISAWGALLNALPANVLATKELAELIFAIKGDSEAAVVSLLANPDAETEKAWTALLVHLPEKLRHAALEALKNKNQNGSAEALHKALHAVLTDTNA